MMSLWRGKFLELKWLLASQTWLLVENKVVVLLLLLDVFLVRIPVELKCLIDLVHEGALVLRIQPLLLQELLQHLLGAISL